MYAAELARYGIDYGMGTTNIDLETGIRYGVISMHEVAWWAEESEAVYANACPFCGYENENYVVGEPCPVCKETAEDWLDSEPVAFTYEQKGYAAQQDADDIDIFVVKSPYFTYGVFCSPCAPGAISLGSISSLDEIDSNNPYDPPVNNRAYCFGHDWFEGGKAPYPVYSVKTGEQV